MRNDTSFSASDSQFSLHDYKDQLNTATFRHKNIHRAVEIKNI